MPPQSSRSPVSGGRFFAKSSRKGENLLMDEEERRFQQWLMSKDPDGLPVWAARGPASTKWRDGPMAQFIKGFLKSKGGISGR